jgi:membrane protease YdiL (CAAX protease family)
LFFYASMFSPALAASLVNRAAAFPRLAAWNPFFLPLMVVDPAAGAARRELLVLLMIAAGAAAMFGAILTCEWLTRDGLVRAGGPYQAARGSEASRRRAAPWLRGIAAQEMLLLRRDRNLLVQVLVVPLLVPAYYLLIDPHLRSALTGNFRRAAMVTFIVGAYSFVSSAMPLLSREDHTLWLLLSFPRSLVSILLEKALFWAVVGLAYGAVVLGALLHFSPHLHVTAWHYVFLAFYGIAVYAFVASGIGILATNVLESERRAQLRVSTGYLYLAVAAMYANIFYSASIWTIVGQLVLSTLLALALWQKVKDVAPYLLDPTQWPPRAISLADGMIAALAFFVAQPLASLLLEHSAPMLSVTAQATAAYIIAGLVIGFAVFAVFWLQGAPGLWKEIALLPAADRYTTGLARGLVQGAIWGAAAALGAFAYLHALSLVPQWQAWKQDAELSSFVTRAGQPLWICVLLIVAAPLFEEFLFRGLVFQGLRRTAGTLAAIVGSAALFAMVHPPVAVLPVFGLGVAAALSFNRSRFLLAPIVTHAVYNGCVLFLKGF